MLDSIKKKAFLVENEQSITVLVKEVLSDDEMAFLMNLSEKKQLPIEVRKASLSEDERSFLQESKKFLNEMDSIPDSEKETIPAEILDRWQSEVG